MDKQELISFVSKFNSSEPISLNEVLYAIKHVSAKDQELLMLLINYKNGKDFVKKLKDGEI